MLQLNHFFCIFKAHTHKEEQHHETIYFSKN